MNFADVWLTMSHNAIYCYTPQERIGPARSSISLQRQPKSEKHWSTVNSPTCLQPKQEQWRRQKRECSNIDQVGLFPSSHVELFYSMHLATKTFRMYYTWNIQTTRVTKSNTTQLTQDKVKKELSQAGLDPFFLCLSRSIGEHIHVYLCCWNVHVGVISHFACIYTCTCSFHIICWSHSAAWERNSIRSPLSQWNRGGNCFTCISWSQ